MKNRLIGLAVLLLSPFAALAGFTVAFLSGAEGLVTGKSIQDILATWEKKGGQQ